MTRTLEQLDQLIQNVDSRNNFHQEKLVELAGRLSAIEQLHGRLEALEVLLNGSPSLREEWAKYKALGVAPNIPEPPIGALERIDTAIAHMGRMFQDRMSELVRKVDKGLDDASDRMAFVRKLELFFAPLLRDKNPPFDGNQIVDRAYVDDGLARFANAFRNEMINYISASKRFVAEAAARAKPGRLQSLIYAITGKADGWR